MKPTINELLSEVYWLFGVWFSEGQLGKVKASFYSPGSEGHYDINDTPWAAQSRPRGSPPRQHIFGGWSISRTLPGRVRSFDIHFSPTEIHSLSPFCSPLHRPSASLSMPRLPVRTVRRMRGILRELFKNWIPCWDASCPPARNGVMKGGDEQQYGSCLGDGERRPACWSFEG